MAYKHPDVTKAILQLNLSINAVEIGPEIEPDYM